MEIEGTFNFRDVGGMPLHGGGQVRKGVLYRSDALSGLTPRGLEQLGASGIGVIVDFRTPLERTMAPDRLPSGRDIRVVELELLEGALTGLAQEAMQAGMQPGGAEAATAAVERALAQLPRLGGLYVSMLTHGGASFAETARLVAHGGDGASGVLVHCTAGKDRTGVATALILDAVGVDRDAVIADYAASQAHLSGAWATNMFAMIDAMGVPRTAALDELVSATPPEAIGEALDWVDREHGGSEAYLRAHGSTATDLDALRGRLVG